MVEIVEKYYQLSLKDLKPGEKGEIASFKGGGAVRKRLLGMGIVKGEIVEMEKVAPLGDPIQMMVKGYHLTLRKNEAESVIVRRVI
jgi:Fe2+ transport system protein FeoA